MNENTQDRLTQALADRYAIRDEIDRGGMAIVYLAEDLKHGRNVAIKVLSPNLSAALGTERFLREIDVIAKLQHPHVLTLIDSGEVDGIPYYVMPFVEGQSLKDRLAREGALPVDQAVGIGREIADALGAAHERGVIHRDMKPGNVLLSGGHAVVADFGIAAALGEAQLGSLTNTGVSLGSPAYMSPEQASGANDQVDLRTDIYGLGCVVYEMLAGEPPFGGSVKTVLTRKLTGQVRPLRELRPDVPAALEAAVARAMAMDPDDRFVSAADLGHALQAGLPTKETPGKARRRTLIAAGATLLVAAVAFVAVQRTRASGQRALWASQQLAEVERLIDSGRLSDALTLANEVEAIFPEDTTLARLLPRFSFTTSIDTDPPGARVYVQYMDEPDPLWEDVGVTPIESMRFAGLVWDFDEGVDNKEPERPVRVRFELDGYRDRELLLPAILGVPWRNRDSLNPVELIPDDPELEGMVRLPGFTRDGIEYDDFFMDRFEVTNADFEEFVGAGGYTAPELWEHPFISGDVELTFEEAMALFEDETGRPGPSTWRFGTFPEGTADHPVGGVSWYEAAAYAAWRGKEIPTSLQWNRGRFYYRENSHIIVPRSNLGSDGPRPVGRNDAMTGLGVYDLAGNVREWLYNEAGPGERATRGGSWTDAPFHVGWVTPKSALDRDPTHGIRLIRTFDPEEELAALQYPVSRTVVRDYTAETPVGDAEFGFFRRLYDYDPVPPNAVVERADTADHWVREHVTFDLPYGERGGAAIYVPTGYERPLQAVVYWGGSGLMDMQSIDEEWTPAFEFLVRSGRVVVVPTFAGAYGRDDPRPATTRGRSSPLGSADNGYRDIAVQWVKDLRTALDYLETRSDIDDQARGFFGFSFGGAMAPIPLVVEPRLGATVLNVGGLSGNSPLPEVDPFHFLPRVRQPYLMINGEHDIVFPYRTRQIPMFDLLGTPDEHKRHYLSPAAHLVPMDEVITETLEWYDRYLGVPK